MRRPRYPGRHPRAFEHKYKELQPDRYASDVAKVVAAGKTPAGSHRPIMLAELLAVTAPQPGEVAVDCTLGYGGHALALLAALKPGGRLLGLDADPIELPRTEARLRAGGAGADVFLAERTNFAALPQAMARHGLAAADVIVADLGVSSMQIDDPRRGFTFKAAAPVDMRMNPARGRPAGDLLAALPAVDLERLFAEHADEPLAGPLAAALAGQRFTTTIDLASAVRSAVTAVQPRAGGDAIERSVRRVFQALRIAVNDELGALDALLRAVPSCLAPGGRVALLTFHSGEDRRVKKALQAGRRDGVYSDAGDVRRPSPAEVAANPRAAAAKLRWARRVR